MRPDRNIVHICAERVQVVFLDLLLLQAVFERNHEEKRTKPCEIFKIVMLEKASFFQIHLFGHDIIALQEHMDIDQLPAELGGTCEDVTSNKWIKLMEKESIKKGFFLNSVFLKLVS